MLDLQTWWIVGAVVAAIVVGVFALRNRPEETVELAVVPTSSFDPSMEDIVRYAGHLVRSRRVRDVAAGRGPIRLSLKAVGEGQLVQTITVPASAVGMLRRHGLAEVEMISMDELHRRLAGVTGTDSSQPGGESETDEVSAPVPGPPPDPDTDVDEWPDASSAPGWTALQEGEDE